MLLENAELRSMIGSADNEEALGFLLSQSDAALRTQTDCNNALMTQLKTTLQMIPRLEASIDQQTSELQNTGRKLQRARNKLKRPSGPCPHCYTLRALIVTERKYALACFIVAVFAIFTAAFCAYSAKASAAQARAADLRSQTCQFEGGLYSVGSVMNTVNLSYVECVSLDHHSSPVWRAKAAKDQTD